MDVKLLIAIGIVLLIAAVALFLIIRKRNPEKPSGPSPESGEGTETPEGPQVTGHPEEQEPAVKEPEIEAVTETEAETEPEPETEPETVPEGKEEPAEPEAEQLPEEEPGPAAEVAGPQEEIKPSPADEIFLEKLQGIVAENVSDQEFDTRVLIESMGLSRTMLFNKVKELTGLNLQNYINKMRMEKAMELMKTTSIPLAEVAEKCGFATPRYFSTSFKNYTGKTPSQFKKELFS